MLMYSVSVNLESDENNTSSELNEKFVTSIYYYQTENPRGGLHSCMRFGAQ